MLPLSGKNMVVIGASRGVGRQIVEASARNGAHVLAVARNEEQLRQLIREVPGTDFLALNATDEAAPARVFEAMLPDLLVLCAGALPPVGAVHEQSWHSFAVNWEVDVKIAFHFFKAALLWPLRPGSSVVLISSGAALGGSPNSGGYAGAKRTQIFLANYSQKESDRMGLGLNFMTLAPRIMPDTQLGKHAVAGYARYLHMTVEEFIKSMDAPPAASDVANAVVLLAAARDDNKGKVFVVSGKGTEIARL